jgi:hypothetical protein
VLRIAPSFAIYACLPYLQVLGTVWVNEHVSSADTIRVEIALRGLQGVSLKRDEVGRRWQASSGNPESSHARVGGGIMKLAM